jgi:uncharacterized protein YbbC (DUF1343 family)
MVKIGLDRLSEIKNLIKDRNVGILTNNSSRNLSLESSIDLIKILGPRRLKVLTPEHGYYGEEQAGEPVKSRFERGIEFISLYYGNTEKIGKNIDENMRKLDTESDQSKISGSYSLEDIDTFIVDLQDIGSRVYTYISTVINLIETQKDKVNNIYILDRPNPVTGKYFEGPILKKGFSSFIGALEIPLRHGLTIGEMARMYNDEVNIVKMNGWRRGMWYDETGLRWVMPSPNMPSLDTALVYQGNVIFEGTNISEGRGTTRPFNIIGAPWLKTERILKIMNSISNGIYKVIETRYRPFFSKYAGDVCNGLDIHILDRENFRPIRFSLKLLHEIMEQEEFQFYEDYFDKVMGTDIVRKYLQNNDIERVFEMMEKDEEKFNEKRSGIILYKV